MNRTTFQGLCDTFLIEAQTLLDQGKFGGAYYLAGYAIECALKACISKLTNQDDFPPGRRFVEDCYSHDLNKLVYRAGLQTDLEAALSSNTDLTSNWGVVKEWNEVSRYERKAEADTRALLEAITDPTKGVLPWIKTRW